MTVERGTSLYAVARPNPTELAAHVLPTPSRSVRFLTAVIEFLGYNPLADRRCEMLVFQAAPLYPSRRPGCTHIRSRRPES